MLLANPELLEGFSSDYFPDGVYERPDGELWAVELEISRKVKKQYREKLNRYVRYIRGNQNSKSSIKKVHFLVAKDAILKVLQEETKIFPEYFLIQSLSEFLAQNATQSKKENT
ncbi:MAG: hypothetical protein ACK5P7_11315 [Bdellovibrio sp.]